jgi:hypothetical protein
VIAARIRTGAIGAIATLAAVTSSAAAFRAHAAASCGVGNGLGYGYSYLTSLSVSHISCATGRLVAKHHGHVIGWRCSKRILDRSPVQYDARVRCTRGVRTVIWTYTQNT